MTRRRTLTTMAPTEYHKWKREEMRETSARDTGIDPMARWKLHGVVFLILGMMPIWSMAGCTRGDGPVMSESRDVGAFTRIEVSGGISGVTVQIGQSGSLEVRAQENILPLVSTEVEADTLTISSTSQSFSTSQGIDVVVVTQTLDEISMSGGSQGQIEGVDAASLTVKLSGGSQITVMGTADTVELEASGGSSANLEDLAATAMTLDVSGGSNATVQVSDTVNGSASGESQVTVHGGAQLNVEVTSGAEVTPG
jgi:hypothetical protein